MEQLVSASLISRDFFSSYCKFIPDWALLLACGGIYGVMPTE